ncbi:MAG: glyoxalase/bleomycin resistance/extradiol dioxygenase family protein [Candidatus Kapabacteria bacterium]|jgi:predicted lactoylglutathione lyase|nr:glyoxalase/bleomycin resistance/extradiol dioxygenase family protein [Candidatus Kapabacteria bacterium]
MAKIIFINLPVKNLERSLQLYTQMGVTINPAFTDNHQKCVMWGEHIYVMLQSHEMFQSHIKKEIPDMHQFQTASYTLPMDSLEQMNETMEKALRAGGKEPVPMIDEGFMQIRVLEDFDGHTWSFIYLDMNKFERMKER